MNFFAPQHFIPILLIVFLLFGKGKLSDLMGDLAKGIKNFRKGLQDDDVVVTREKEKKEGRLASYDQEVCSPVSTGSTGVSEPSSSTGHS